MQGSPCQKELADIKAKGSGAVCVSLVLCSLCRKSEAMDIIVAQSNSEELAARERSASGKKEREVSDYIKEAMCGKHPANCKVGVILHS